MSKLVILNGVSGVGKSTISRFLCENENFKNHHPIKFYLTTLEKIYNLPSNFLDFQEGKQSKIPFKENTFRNFLEGYFQFIQKHDDSYTAKAIEHYLYELLLKSSELLTGFNVVTQSIRTLKEAEAVTKVCERIYSQNKDFKVYYINIIRPNNPNNKFNSYKYYDSVHLFFSDWFKNSTYTTYSGNIENDKDILTLYNRVKYILKD